MRDALIATGIAFYALVGILFVTQVYREAKYAGVGPGLTVAALVFAVLAAPFWPVLVLVALLLPRRP